MQDHCSHLFTKLQPPVVPMIVYEDDIRHVGQLFDDWDLPGRRYHFLQFCSIKSLGKVGDGRRGAKDSKAGVSWKICPQIRFIASLDEESSCIEISNGYTFALSFETRWKQRCSPLMSNPCRHSN